MERTVKLDPETERIVEAAARERGVDFDWVLNSVVLFWAKRWKPSPPPLTLSPQEFEALSKFLESLGTDERLRRLGAYEGQAR